MQNCNNRNLNTILIIIFYLVMQVEKLVLNSSLCVMYKVNYTKAVKARNNTMCEQKIIWLRSKMARLPK